MTCATIGNNVAEHTAQVKQEGTFLVVGESETAMLYEIKEENGKFNLYLNKKKGFKFKKSFDGLDEAEWFIERYLAHSCVSCKAKGWVYKARSSGGLHRGGSRGHRPWIVPVVDSVVTCPECSAEHYVRYDDWRLFLIPKTD